MRTTSAASLVLIACAALLAGCSDGGDAKEPPAPDVVKAEAGTCVADEVDDGIDVAPDVTTVVPCDEPHRYEILDVVPIPERFLGGETDAERLAIREEYATPFTEGISERKQAMIDVVYQECDTPTDVAGMSDLEVAGKPADEIGLRPYNRLTTWYTVTSEEQWLAGQTAVVCSVRFYETRDRDSPDDETSPATTVTSPDEEQVVTHYLSDSFPLEQRGCTGGEGNRETVSCDGPHVDEHLFQLDMRALYGDDFARGVDLSDVRGDTFTQIIDGCREPYEQAGFSVPSDRRIGFRYDGKDVDGDYLNIYCVLETPDDAPTREYAAFTS